MVIDFHTHTFPDKNAERSIAYLEHKGNIKAFCDAKRGTLVNNMLNWGVDFSVVLPVATVPKQEHTITALSAEISGRDNVYYFGAIHPIVKMLRERSTISNQSVCAESNCTPTIRACTLMTKGT